MKINYRYGNTEYAIELIQDPGENNVATKIVMDGKEESGTVILLVDDGVIHTVKIYLREQLSVLQEK